ncbi:uncharacterized protein OCT59_010022 [Rhizophagus irregularis]|uniref:uncharacterized protein n=1 Tax=Rhizophagus irregularis TaxID=588596 RepID=UPI003328C13E|nr:hypothetical protein OCT59_010022 [Rhizophagus irregularis]
MSTYTELASIINSTDSISDKVIYDASHNQFTIVSDETVLKIIRALKDTIVVALVSGFSKTSYLVQDHVKYIKRIQTANSPVSYVKFVARKLFPDNAAYTAKIAKIRESYKNKQALLDKLEALFELYYNATKDSSTVIEDSYSISNITSSLDRLPVEIVERIVAKIPDTDLIAASKVDSVWWQEVRQEAYKRWKNYATTIGHVQALGKPFEKGNIDWISFEDVNDFYKRWIDRLTEDQLYIMEKMLRNGMVVDPQERETIEHALSEQRWGGDPWRLDWKWNEWTQQE